jgi:hypothetical protein
LLKALAGEGDDRMSEVQGSSTVDRTELAETMRVAVKVIKQYNALCMRILEENSLRNVEDEVAETDAA